MKKYLASFLGLLFCCALSFGQTTAPAPAPVQHFVISASAAGYNGQSGATALSIAGTGIQLTTNVSVAYNLISNPSDNTAPKYNLGVINYSRGLDAILGKTLSSKLTFDTSNFVVTFQAGAGKVSMPSAHHIAETGGIYLSRPLADHVSLQIVGYQVLHGQGTTVLTHNVTQQISSGLNFTF